MNKDEIRSFVESYFEKINIKENSHKYRHIYYYGHFIHKSKLMNALNTYANSKLETEKVLLLLDNTLWGSA